MIVGNPIIMILKAILNWFRLRRDYIANAVDKIPPEIKDALVAWYSPVKQKLSNYDVIEAYVEDFSKNPWNNKTEKYVGNLTSKALTVTEVLVRSALIYTNIKPYNFKVRITGLINNQKVIFGDDTSLYRALIVDKDGIYDINWEDNHKAYCIWIDFIGECNIAITQLPTSIIKDFSGNKHDAYLYGFKGKLNSGVGIYKIDFSKTANNNAFDNFERFNNKFVAKGRYNGNWSVFGQYIVNGIVKNKVTIKITGVSNLSYKLALQYGYITKDSKYIQKEIFIDKDGIYSYDINDIEIPDENNIEQTIYNRFYFDKETINDVNLIVEEIPDYPNQLCYDGKSYAVAYGLPILTDYTVMAERTWFEKEEYSAFISNSLGGMEEPNNGAFCVEIKSLNSFTTSSFGSLTSIDIPEKGITYQTKQSYNGNSINVGTKESNDILILGGRYFYKINNDVGNIWNGCHGDILLFNRTLTDDELDLVKEHFFGIESNIKDALMTTDKKYLALVNNNNYIKLNK